MKPNLCPNPVKSGIFRLHKQLLKALFAGQNSFKMANNC